MLVPAKEAATTAMVGRARAIVIESAKYRRTILTSSLITAAEGRGEHHSAPVGGNRSGAWAADRAQVACAHRKADAAMRQTSDLRTWAVRRRINATDPVAAATAAA